MTDVGERERETERGRENNVIVTTITWVTFIDKVDYLFIKK